jgi:hypothetical protein
VIKTPLPTTAASDNDLELKIQDYLQRLDSVELTADALVKELEYSTLNFSQFQTLARFLHSAGLHATLVDLVTRKLADGSFTPWAHYADSLVRSLKAVTPHNQIPINIAKNIVSGALSENALSELSRTKVLDAFETELPEEREKRRNLAQILRAHHRESILDQLQLLQSQQLFDQEEELLQQFQNEFPEDSALEPLWRDFKDRKAQAYLSWRSERNPSRTNAFRFPPEVKDPEVEKAFKIVSSQMKALAQKDPALTADFALAHIFWDSQSEAAEILASESDLSAKGWLRCEALVKSQRFVELLVLIEELQKLEHLDPEVSFACSYFRAQALWGLGKKIEALQMMEGVVQLRPQYRSASALLDEWKEQYS